MTSRGLWRSAFLCAVFGSILISPVLTAQTTFGTIRGTVLDPAQAAVPRVEVTVTNEGTNISRQTTTADGGDYEVTHLNPGSYSVTAEAPGFQRLVYQRVLLETGQSLRIDMKMSVGHVTENITVSSEVPLVETDTGTISDVRTGRQMRELPLNMVRGDAFGGGIFKYMSLSPGSFRYEGASSHSFGGSRSSQNNFVMDGTQLGDQGGGQVTPAQPSFESVQEMKLIMVNNSAEYPGVASVIVTSKSGTNKFHGSLFHQYSTGSLNARNFFATGKPFRVYNQFGASIGGPVLLPRYNGRNRTFFFYAFEGNRNHTQTVFNSSVPTAAIRRGNFSQVRDSRAALIVVRDPANNQPFAGNLIPASRVSPVSARIQDRFFQAPNFGPPDQLQQNLRAQVGNAPLWNHFDTRIDHRINDKNSFFGRFSWRNMPTPVPEGELPDTGLRDQMRRIRNMSLVDTHIFSPRVINELRAGFAWHENRFQGPLRGLPIVRELGIRGLTATADIAGVPNVRINDFSQITQIEHQRSQDMVYDFIDNLTIVKGRHSLKLGYNFRRQQASRNSIPITIFGRYDFTGAFTGFSYADFLLGIPQSTFRNTPQGRTYGRNQIHAGYIQDDFKLHSRLTLNLGLRYEWMNPFADKFDRMFNFDPATGNLVVPTRTVIERDVVPIFPASIGIVSAQEAGFPRRGLRRGDNNNFGPRVGLAWRPLDHNRTVVRSGFGVYHNNLSSSTFHTLSQGGPFTSNENFVNRIVNGVPLFQFPEPFLGVGSPGSQNISAVEAGLFNPYTMQWNFTLEQEFLATGFRASYIGTRSVNLLYRRNFNQPPASVTPFNNNRRPYPQYRNVTLVANGGNSMYHALQVEAERKLARGVYYQVGWTWAKQLSHGLDSGEQGAGIQDAYNRRPEWGDDLFLGRHRMVASYIWELPFGPGRKWLNGWRGLAGQLVGGWNLSGITLFQTGQRFTPSFTGRDPSNTDTIGGRPDRIGAGNLPKSERTIDRWFDFNAFVIPPLNAGRFGNAGNGILAGPGTVNWDLGLYKNVSLGERRRLEFSFTTTNALNHPNFSTPNADISSITQRGRIRSLQSQDESGARTVMLGTRIEF